MAISLRFHLLVLLILLLLVSLFTSSAASTYTDGGATPPFSASAFQAAAPPPPQAYPPALFATILSTLGFQELSTATALAPIFSTKIEKLAPNRCLTVTTDDKKEKVFVNGVEITSPDLFNNGLVVIHGMQGFVSHLSPLLCNFERMTSLSLAATPPPHSIMRLMLKDAIIRLRGSGYGVVSLALRVKFVEMSELKALTIFELDDAAIFSGGGYSYLSNFRFPNRRLTAAELVSLPSTTTLPTMSAGNNLVVTTAGGGGPLAPMKINYVKVITIDLLHNSRIVVHGVSSPFPHMHHHPIYDERETSFAEIQRSKCDHFDDDRGMCVVEAEVPAGLQSEVVADDRSGL